MPTTVEEVVSGGEEGKPYQPRNSAHKTQLLLLPLALLLWLTLPSLNRELGQQQWREKVWLCSSMAQATSELLLGSVYSPFPQICYWAQGCEKLPWGEHYSNHPPPSRCTTGCRAAPMDEPGQDMDASPWERLPAGRKNLMPSHN